MIVLTEKGAVILIQCSVFNYPFLCRYFAHLMIITVAVRGVSRLLNVSEPTGSGNI